MNTFHKQAWLTSEQWQALAVHLSKPLDDASKGYVIDFLDFRLLQYTLEQIPQFKTRTLATLYHEIVAFKETAQALIPKAELKALEDGIHLFTQLSSEAETALKSAHFNLSLNAKAAIGNELYLMTRTDTGKHLYHPSQYDIAAKLALEKMPKPKQYQGRGNPLSVDKMTRYTHIFKLWRDLKETDFAIWHNTELLKSSPLVAFTHALFKAELECIKRYDPKTQFKDLKEQAICKHMKEFKKLIPYYLEN